MVQCETNSKDFRPDLLTELLKEFSQFRALPLDLWLMALHLGAVIAASSQVTDVQAECCGAPSKWRLTREDVVNCRDLQH